MYRGEGHDGDGDRRACHVDCSAEGDGHGVELAVKSEALAQGHVNGDVSCRGAGEECGNAAFLQALEHQRIRVLADDYEGHDGVDNKRRYQHAADEDQQELAVFGEDGKAAGGNCGEHEAEDTEGSEVYYKADCLGDCVGCICEELLGGVGRCLERKAEHDRPEQDAEVVSGDYRADGVGDDVVKKSCEYRSKAVGSSVGGRIREGDGHGENEACDDRDHSCKEGGNKIQNDDRSELLAHLFSRLCQCADDKDKHQQGRYRLERADEQSAEDTDSGRGFGSVGDNKRKYCADDHTYNNSKHEAYAVICFYDFHFSFLILLLRCGLKPLCIV